MTHFNCRSLPHNYDKIIDCLKDIKVRFDIIALTETWLNENNKNIFTLNDYELCHIVRQCRSGGCVSLYIKRGIQYIVLGNSSICINNCLECLTVELTTRTRKKNIRLCVMYRQPGSNIDDCVEYIMNIFTTVSKLKTCYLCGDLNIYLLKFENHKKTKDFIESLFSIGMFPQINRPSRITEYSATLIDNIFTNDIASYKVNGLLISDVSDHLPIFSIIKNYVAERKYVTKRQLNSVAIDKLKADLLNVDWNKVYQDDGVNVAYNSFFINS